MSCLKSSKSFKIISRFLKPNPIRQIRFASRMCEDKDKINKCITTTPSFEQQPCATIRRKPKPADSQPQYAYLMRSMWEKPNCCKVCEGPLMPIRHDILYLKEVDYRQRKYQRTWPQCPIRCKIQKKCYFPKFKAAEMEIRPRGQGNPDAKMCAKVNECAKVEKYDENCPAACRPKKSCRPAPGPSCCQKRCTLYPSYSECCAKALVEKRPTECACLYPGGLCAMNEYARRMGIKWGKDE